MASHPNVVECTYPEIPSGTTVHDTISGTVDPALAAGTQLVNQVVTVSAAYDPALGNNRAVAAGVVTVLPPVIDDLASSGGELRGTILVGALAAFLIGMGWLAFVVSRRRKARD